MAAYSAESPNSKPVRRAMCSQLPLCHNLDVGLWSMLPDHLKEKIIASLPFKSFFQISSSLSKIWRFTVASPWFKMELQNSSSSWESYCPVYRDCYYTGMEFVGYESGSKSWHRLPPHSYLPKEVNTVDWVVRAGNGSLFCWTCPYPNSDLDDRYGHHVFVTNPLTRSWKQLPLRPDMHFPDFMEIYLEGNKAYKMILGRFTKLDTFYGQRYSISVQMFDSIDKFWTTEVYTTTGTNIARIFHTTIFTNGFLYVLANTFTSGFMLISLDVKKKVWSEIPLQLQAVDEDLSALDQLLNMPPIHFVKLLVCRSHVMMAISYEGNMSNMGSCAGHGCPQDTQSILSVFKLDVERGMACEQFRAPNNLLGIRSLHQNFSVASAHGDCIYVDSDEGDLQDRLLIYNVRTRQWHWIPFAPNRPRFVHVMVPVSYQPGLNPLLEV